MMREALHDEIESVVWLFEQVRSGKSLPIREAEATVHCLQAASIEEGAAVLTTPVTASSEDTYLPVAAVNIALTAMIAAQSLQFEPESVRAVGLAGLLHDIGMVRLPAEVLNKNALLSNEDRALLMSHPAAGAAIIFEADSARDIVAVAAYEHHVRPDGGGYPTLIYARIAHRISRLIAVCSGYHALTSARPFRGAWSPAEALTIIEAGRGRDYDPQMVGLLASLVRSANQPRSSESKSHGAN